jgi:hypothetical protein
MRYINKHRGCPSNLPPATTQSQQAPPTQPFQPLQHAAPVATPGILKLEQPNGHGVRDGIVAAFVLDPCMKLEYINSTWESKWIPDAKAMVVQLWKKYRSAGDPTSDLISDSRSDPTHQRLPNTFTSWKQQKSGRRADHIDEYFRYIREPPIPHDHIKGGRGACSWWLEERQ